MQQQLPDYLYTTVTDAERDLGLRLDCYEQTAQDYLEEPISFDGDKVSYRGQNVLNVEAFARGFAWDHPNGGTIRGMFDKPILLAASVLADDGEELQYTSNQENLAKAILAKLGNMAGLEDLKVCAGA